MRQSVSQSKIDARKIRDDLPLERGERRSYAPREDPAGARSDFRPMRERRVSNTVIKNMDQFSEVSGISRPTLSKYFNDPASVRPKTRQRIEAALLRHDYRPNLFAINQNRRATKNIGVIVPHIVDPFYAEMVRQIETRCLEAGYWAIVVSSHRREDLESNALDTLRSLKVAGAIIAPLGASSDHERFRRFEDRIPTIFFDNHLGGEPAYVGTDNRQSIGLIVDYLCRSGEPPCFIDMTNVNTNARDRHDAYCEAMDARGAKPQVIQVDGRDWNFEQLGYDMGRKQLAGRGFPSSSVLCANDRIAFGLLAAAYEAGVRVGRGAGSALRIAGHDDHPLSRFTSPPLTTVAQNYAAIAETCLNLLFQRVEARVAGADPVSQELPATLILRASA